MPSSSETIDGMYALYDQGRLQEALTHGLELAARHPDEPRILYILGAANAGLERWDEAIAHYRKLLQTKPDHAEAYAGLGNVLHRLGKNAEAVSSYTKALQIKPNFAVAHYNLGHALQDLGRHEDALLSFTKAAQIKPDFAAAHNSLGNVLHRFKRRKEALASYAKAVALAPDRKQFWANLARVLSEISFGGYGHRMESIFLGLLDQETIVKPNLFAKSILSLLKPHPHIKEALRISAAGGVEQSAPDICAKLSTVPLFLRIIGLCPIPDLEVENLLTELRKALLLGGDSVKDKPGVLRFQTALALHCFTNEFLFTESDAERAAVEALESELEDLVSGGAEPDPFKLACLASYRPLHRYAWSHNLNVPDSLKELYKRQVEDVLEEASLLLGIPCLKEIDAPISIAVRQQYEENPYPRWVNTKLPHNPLGISIIARHIGLRLQDNAQTFSDRPDILVAGCGTGQHSIVTASRFLNCNVLAVDLSRASLSHAVRKTRELGVSNIEYMQADILDLESLGRQFDLIESVGVLHHMADPMAGWQVLINCLKPGGLMKVGLYSELGRKSIVEARDIIATMELGSSDDDIRKFREHVIHHEVQDTLKQVTKMKDFFSTSSCRDLLFHVQERRYALPQIKEAIDTLGLTFVGFELAKKATKQKLKQDNPDPHAVYSLDAWHEFEMANPNVFRLYQFWVQKNL